MAETTVKTQAPKTSTRPVGDWSVSDKEKEEARQYVESLKK